MLEDLIDRLAPVRLTPRGGALLGVAIVGAFVAYIAGWPALLAVALFALAAVAVGVAMVLLAPVRVEVEHRLEPEVTEQDAPVAVRLTVRGRTGVTAEWRDAVHRSLDVLGEEHGVLPRLSPLRPEYEAGYAVVGTRRGVQPVGPLLVDVIDPLGVAEARRRVGGEAGLTVLPRVHDVAAPLAVARVDLDPAATALVGVAGDQRDIIAREYRAGDPMRQVDWRSTAHRGELMVRAEAATAASVAAVVFDTRSSVWPDGSTFEWAVEAVASLVVATDGAAGEVRLVTPDRVAPDADLALLDLATVQMSGSSARLASLVAAARGAEVQAVHVVTAGGAARELAELPPVGGAVVGVVSVVSVLRGDLRQTARGWRAFALDPLSPVDAAWRDHG